MALQIIHSKEASFKRTSLYRSNTNQLYKCFGNIKASPRKPCDHGLKKDFAGLDAQKDLVTQNRTSFPDLRLTIDETIVMGDTIAMRWTLSGTNNGPIGEIPATGNKVQFPGVSVVHMANGKAVEIWDVYNQLDIMEQLGFTVAPRKKTEQK